MAFIITATLLAAYCLLILLYRKWFIRLPLFRAEASLLPSVYFSIIIPARNEEDNITACLQSVLGQDYPSDRLEVIVVNDHSTDGTEALIRDMQECYPNLVLINMIDYPEVAGINSYKKKALEIAIGKTKGEWMITTDADCTAHKQWLRQMDAFISKIQPVFIAAPVMFTHKTGLLSMFQLLDFISLQGITAAAVSAGYHAMCNGANLAYRKDAFYTVNGFAGIDRLASGDDMFLMNKMREHFPGKLGYLFCKEAIVSTAPMTGWKNFLNQRIRWASKANQYRDRSIFWVLLLVYLVNFSLLALLPVSVFSKNGLYYWLVLMLVKTGVELTFMIPAAEFFGRKKALVWFPLMQPLHLLYTVIAGWLGRFGAYHWKGRKVR